MKHLGYIVLCVFTLHRFTVGEVSYTKYLGFCEMVDGDYDDYDYYWDYDYSAGTEEDCLEYCLNMDEIAGCYVDVNLECMVIKSGVVKGGDGGNGVCWKFDSACTIKTNEGVKKGDGVTQGTCSNDYVCQPNGNCTMAPCDSNPCLNDGICYKVGNANKCLCNYGYTGDDCGKGRYFKAASGTECPLDKLISSEKECKQAVSSLDMHGGNSHEQTYRPAGCYWYSQSSWSNSTYTGAIFNTIVDPSNTTNSDFGDTGGVCINSDGDDAITGAQ